MMDQAPSPVSERAGKESTTSPASAPDKRRATAPDQGPDKVSRLTRLRPSKRWIQVALVLVLAGAGYYGWLKLRPPGLPADIGSGNGRIEATEIDIATKLPARIADILVDEGDFVEAGQVLVHMDIKTLEAQRREAEAQFQRATISVETAQILVKQREAERTAAAAEIAVRQALLDAATRRFARTVPLAQGGLAASQQRLDDDRAAVNGAAAAVASSQAVLAAAEAAISSAKSQIVDAMAAVKAAQATIERIDADINDSTLRTPRFGRVQAKVAQQGEVLAAGGRVLDLVALTDVYMTFYLPTDQAGRVALGAEARIILDAAPQWVIPAHISFVADVAQFTPKTVETAVERQKLMFRVKAQIAPELLRTHVRDVKTGLPGMAYVKLDPNAQWPANLQQVRLPPQ
jgi:HlyD family secretion protein